MKGSAITGPVGKEAAELWPVSAAQELPLHRKHLTSVAAYRQQLGCRDVKDWLSVDSSMVHVVEERRNGGRLQHPTWPGSLRLSRGLAFRAEVFTDVIPRHSYKRRTKPWLNASHVKKTQLVNVNLRHQVGARYR